MVLVDTSIWVDHLRVGDARLVVLLEAGKVLMHPFVLGELALGSLRNRDVVISSMRDLPQAAVPTFDEVMHFVKQRALFGLGIGYVDVHLLAAAQLTAGATLWTRDRRLSAVAEKLSLTTTNL